MICTRTTSKQRLCTLLFRVQEVPFFFFFGLTFSSFIEDLCTARLIYSGAPVYSLRYCCTYKVGVPAGVTLNKNHTFFSTYDTVYASSLVSCDVFFFFFLDPPSAMLVFLPFFQLVFYLTLERVCMLETHDTTAVTSSRSPQNYRRDKSSPRSIV